MQVALTTLIQTAIQQSTQPLALPNRPIGVSNSGIISAENSAQTTGSAN
jgi:hypothetical protein